ncbi:MULTISPECIES: hypothetical protein [unclassified Haladaptatus]|uniref:hypothetical protein n=1 Tax=unclassified Haladaptatus TaxID=2622732 RepID=UPI00209BDC2D|nr:MULTISPECIES: hypothetical protein [unclassified Haladaptatus]MCO8244686.1 hypothetical protein [Haladaptatus sp. AB643]MCO8255801.1 hypothetical protein [Haladaptatus sp. AB618]
MTEFVVEIDDHPKLELDNLDVGVEEDVIAFDVTGTIRDLDDDLLDALTDKTLRPTEVHFTTDD